ncbi:hypothetical protein N9O40_01020 [Planktomarina sp.]|nr:hypothetical protein [Planktomarina sp.]
MKVSVLFQVAIEPELDTVLHKLEFQNTLLLVIVAYGATGPIAGYKKNRTSLDAVL